MLGCYALFGKVSRRKQKRSHKPPLLSPSGKEENHVKVNMLKPFGILVG
jgi:hypothetical protein